MAFIKVAYPQQSYTELAQCQLFMLSIINRRLVRFELSRNKHLNFLTYSYANRLTNVYLMAAIMEHYGVIRLPIRVHYN
jgi:hypothetical protein